MNHLPTIDVIALTQVTGGAEKPQPKQPKQPKQEQPKPADETKWIKNTVKCTRIGGPLLGALCGVLTPTPAN